MTIECYLFNLLLISIVFFNIDLSLVIIANNGVKGRKEGFIELVRNYQTLPLSLSSAHLSRLSQLETSWVAAATASAGLGLQSTANNPAWLAVYLGVAKLLDQAVVLPADQLPQFQMYRWAFVREGDVRGSDHEQQSLRLLQESEADLSQLTNNNGPLHQDFVPHVARISRLMKTKVR